MMSEVKLNPQGINYLYFEDESRLAIPHNAIELFYHYDNCKWIMLLDCGDYQIFSTYIDNILSKHLNRNEAYKLLVGRETPKKVEFNWNEEDLNNLALCIEKRWIPAVKENMEPNCICDCHLCELEISRGSYFQDCDNCVIAKDTGASRCSATPYYDESDENKGKEMLSYLKDLHARMLNSLKMKVKSVC